MEYLDDILLDRFDLYLSMANAELEYYLRPRLSDDPHLAPGNVCKNVPKIMNLYVNVLS